MHKIPYKNPENTFLRGLIEYRNYVLAIDRLIVIDPLIIKDGLFPKTSRIVTQKNAYFTSSRFSGQLHITFCRLHFKVIQ